VFIGRWWVDRPIRVAALGCSLWALLLIACAAPATSTNAPPESGSTSPDVPSSSLPSGRAPSPLVLIVMENHERSDVVGSPSAPYQNSLVRHGRDFTNYFAVAHPSLPNYVAIASGTTVGKGGSDEIAAGELTGVTTVWDQLTAAGIPWAVYEETMPSPCYASSSAGEPPADYVLKHNPATPFGSVFSDRARCERVRPLTRMDPSRLPAFSFITPNECDDAHSCGLGTGDQWLSQQVPPLLAAGADVLITYDEGTTDLGAHGAGGGQVYAVEVGAGVPPISVGTVFDHYSLLAGIEARFGLIALGAARYAPTLPL
jgi:hypothetical protein